MADLGNKMNPWLAGLTGLGEGLLQGYLYKQKMNQRQEEFNRKMAMEERQQSLLDLMNQKKFELEQQTYNTNLQNQQYDNFINTTKEFNVADEAQSVPYAGATQTRPSNSFLGDPNNPYLKGKILTEKIKAAPKTAIKTAEIPNMNGKRGYINLDTGEFEKDARGNVIIAGEESGGLSALAQFNIDKEKRDNQIKVEQAQKTYDDIMDSWDEKVGAYVVRKPNGSPLLFRDEKSLRQYATRETLKLKPPGKVNFWMRESQSPSNTMTKDDFMADFKKEQGRIPTATELLKAKQKGYWK